MKTTIEQNGRFRAELDLYFEPRPMKAIRPDWYADKPETATTAE